MIIPRIVSSALLDCSISAAASILSLSGVDVWDSAVRQIVFDDDDADVTCLWGSLWIGFFSNFNTFF